MNVGNDGIHQWRNARMVEDNALVRVSTVGVTGAAEHYSSVLRRGEWTL